MRRAQPRQQQQQQQDEPSADVPMVTVSGRGTVSVTPDRATVTLGAEFQDKEAVAAQSRVNETVAEMTEAVRDLDIEGLTVQTSAINLGPVYSFNRNRAGNRERQLEGYRASITVSVRIDQIERAGEVIDAAMKAGANEMRGINFSLKNDSDAMQNALREAVGEARRKAQTIAEATGMPLGDLLDVQEVGTVQPLVSRRASRGGDRMMPASAEMAPTPIEAGELQVNASVQITYRLGD
jgi:hypothetical protein